MMKFVTRADGANPIWVDLRGPLNINAPKPIPCPAWDKEAPMSKLLCEQNAQISDVDVEAVRLIAMGLVTGHPVCLVGPQGCGKSSLIKLIAGVTNWELVIVQGSETAEMIDLMGIRMPDGQWIENGPLDAYRNGKLLLIEEVNRYSASTSTDMNSIYDRAPLRVSFLGEDAYAHPNFMAMLTSNTVGNGEGIESFLSDQIQTPAVLRRRLVHKMGYMNEEKEKELVRRVHPNAQPVEVSLLCRFASDTRKGGVPPLSTAELVMVAELLSLSQPRFMTSVLNAVYFSKLTATQCAAAQELWQQAGGVEFQEQMAAASI